MANKRFKRQEYARYKKLGIKWRRPRGKTSKMRRYEAGKPDMPACLAAEAATEGFVPSRADFLSVLTAKAETI